MRPWLRGNPRRSSHARPTAVVFAAAQQQPSFDGSAPAANRQQQKGRQQQQRQQQQQQRRRQGPTAKTPVLLFQGGAGAGAGAATAAAEADLAAAMLLTRQITSSKDWPQLQSVLEDRIFSLNAVHISAAMHQLSRIVGPRGAASLPLALRREVTLVVEALLERLEEVRESLGGQETACCVGALARLGLRHPHHVPWLVSGSSGRLDRFRNKELMHLGWAAARLGYVPPPGWLEEFQDETYARMPSLNEQELGNAIWAFAKWGRAPSAPWVERFMERLPGAIVSMEPPGICSTLWAAVMLGMKLPGGMVDALLLESQVKFSSFNAHGLATLAWSLCSLDVRPRRMWLDDYVRHVGARMSAWNNDQCFTNTLWALSNWEHRPPEEWLDECCRLSLPFLDGMNLNSLNIMAAALADLDYCPPVQWSSLLLERVHAKHDTLRQQQQQQEQAGSTSSSSGNGSSSSNGGGTSISSGSGGGSRSSTQEPGAVAPKAGSGGSVRGGSSRGGDPADTATFIWSLSRLLRSPRPGGSWAGGGPQRQQHQSRGGPAGGAGADGRGQDSRAGGATRRGGGEGGDAGGGGGSAPGAEGPSASWLRRYRPLLADLAGHAASEMPRLPLTGLVDVVVGCADLGFFPGAAWMDAHESAVNDAIVELSAYQFNLVQEAYGKLEQAMMAEDGRRQQQGQQQPQQQQQGQQLEGLSSGSY